MLLSVAPLCRAQPPAVADLADATQRIISATNEIRRHEGRRDVAPNPALTAAARYFAGFLARSDTYSHTADGRRHDERATQRGYAACIVTENIAYQFRSQGFSSDTLAAGFVQGWERSPGHRKNMLGEDVTDTGVGVAQNSKTGYYYAVQMFGLPRTAMIEFRIGNRSSVEVSYKLGDRRLTLAPGETRIHKQCGATQFEFALGDAKPIVVTPRNGERYVVGNKGTGEVELRKE